MLDFEEIRKTEEISFHEDGFPMGTITRVNDNAFVVERFDHLSEIWLDKDFSWQEVIEMVKNDSLQPNHTDGINAWVKKNP